MFIEKLGKKDAGRSVGIAASDNFDYTEWQRNLWEDKTIGEIHKMAQAFERRKRSAG